MTAPSHFHLTWLRKKEGVEPPKERLCADQNCPQTKAMELLRELEDMPFFDKPPEARSKYGGFGSRLEAYLVSLSKSSTECQYVVTSRTRNAEVCGHVKRCACHSYGTLSCPDFPGGSHPYAPAPKAEDYQEELSENREPWAPKAEDTKP